MPRLMPGTRRLERVDLDLCEGDASEDARCSSAADTPRTAPRALASLRERARGAPTASPRRFPAPPARPRWPNEPLLVAKSRAATAVDGSPASAATWASWPSPLGSDNHANPSDAVAAS